jgi:hypothetical protein
MRQTTRLIDHIQDVDGTTRTDPFDILRVFTSFMQRKYEAWQTDPQALRDIIQTISTGIPTEAGVDLIKPTDMDELKLAVHQGKNWKVPGIDGICLEFYQHTCDTTKHDILKIINRVNVDVEILNSQKKGVIVCIPKKIHTFPTI